MLLYYTGDICKGILILFLLIWLIAGYTFIVNQNRSADDPKKDVYHPFAILLAPVTFPFFALAALVVFFIRALLFALFLIIFSILLIALRKPFIFKLWDMFATWIGDPLLKANTALIRMAIRPWSSK
ncbi:MAG TPA: hypothetical protein VFY26_12870, partial [Anaerolineales bacterium]|nr:hypothetical protein [Anaerolineales bacterium]